MTTPTHPIAITLTQETHHPTGEEEEEDRFPPTDRHQEVAAVNGIAKAHTIPTPPITTNVTSKYPQFTHPYPF